MATPGPDADPGAHVADHDDDVSPTTRTTTTVTPQQQRPRDRKKVIARHARALFSERGFNSVTMNEIAEAVGITAPALYRHYANKQDLLFDVVNSSQRRFLAALEGLGTQQTIDPQRALDEGLAALADASLASEHFAALWQREARHLKPDDQASMRARLNAMADRLASTIAAARPDLSATRAEVRGWAVLAVMVSPGHHGQSLPRPSFERFLTAASSAALWSQDPASGVETAAAEEDVAGVPLVSRREQILAAAARAFRRQGYQGVGTDEIGAAAGVAGPALYRHFDAKADILVALIQRHQEWVAYGASVALRRIDPAKPVDVLTALVRSYIAVGAHAPDLLSVTMTEWLDLPAEKVEALERARTDYRSAWAHWVVQVRPDLTRSDAFLLVRTAMILIDDTVRIPHLLRLPSIEEQLTALAVAVMRDTAW